MQLEHLGKRPRVHDSAYIAPNAVLCGDVTIGAHSRVLFGAVLTAETGPVKIGQHCIVMEHAVLRGTQARPVALGDHVLVGPHAHLTGCTVEDNVFLATGTRVFNGAHIGQDSEVRINAVVHLQTRLPQATIVPIGWIAVGDPADILPPQEHERIWAVQEALDFPQVVFGQERAPNRAFMPTMTERYARALNAHREDRILPIGPTEPT